VSRTNPEPAKLSKADGQGRLRSLDGFRAISILMVLCGHLTGTQGFPITSRHLATVLSHLGVTVFFVISGFLITTLLDAEYRLTGAISLRNFYARRALRILPAFVVFLASLVVAGTCGFATLTGTDVVASLTWTVNYFSTRSWAIGHLWSLSVEEQFYLLWPAALALAGATRGLRVAVAVFLLGPLTRLLMHLFFRGSPLRDLEVFPAVADSIAIGCCVGLMRSSLVCNRTWLWLTAPRRLLALFAGALLMETFSGYTVVDVTLGPLKLLCIAALVEGGTRYDGIAHRCLNWSPIVWIGTLSYSLYLWQQPFLDRSRTSALNAFPQNLLCAGILACMSFYLVERPMLRLRAHFRSKTP